MSGITDKLRAEPCCACEIDHDLMCEAADLLDECELLLRVGIYSAHREEAESLLARLSGGNQA